jgi:pimeloyl-ACP methyl ester carboxylesterase
VRQLVLIGNSVPLPVSPLLLDAAHNDPDRAFALINKFSFAPAEVLGASRRQVLEAANLQRMQQVGAPALASDLVACNAWQGGLDAASQVRCPTIVISGELDQMTPVDRVIPLLDALEKGGGGTSMIVLPGCGHSIMQESPEPLLEALREP